MRMLCRFEYDAPDYIPFEPALEIQKAVSTPRRPKDPFLYTLVCSWALFCSSRCNAQQNPLQETRHAPGCSSFRHKIR